MEHNTSDSPQAAELLGARRVRWISGVALAAALLAGLALLLVRLNARGGLEIALPTATVEPAEIKVYVSGAVARPGVYTLRPGDRLEEALRAAGGATPDADLLAVNLAARLRDEQQVVVPARMPGSLPTPAPLDINIASVEALQALPGIGPARAAAIVRYREEYGPFPDVQALERVPGIGPVTVDRLKGMAVAR